MLGKMKKSGILSFLAAVFLLCGCSPKEEPVLAEAQIQEEADESAEEEGEPQDASDVKKTVVVHVCGQVANPGVYELPEGSRLYEAIQAAGGLSEKAAPEGLNQAAQAEDGQQIYVPSAEELSGGLQAPQTYGQDDGRVNINTAGEEELMTLTGIGEAKAAAIIQYREEKGGFQSIEELMEISGIKEGVFEKIKDKIKV
nr:helix-hairpin-helix domain-containing protein [uncultured Merdimonas sp.]